MVCNELFGNPTNYTNIVFANEMFASVYTAICISDNLYVLSLTDMQHYQQTFIGMNQYVLQSTHMYWHHPGMYQYQLVCISQCVSKSTVMNRCLLISASIRVQSTDMQKGCFKSKVTLSTKLVKKIELRNIYQIPLEICYFST